MDDLRESLGERDAGKRVSGLAKFAVAAPFLGLAVGFAILGSLGNVKTGRLTSAEAEGRELACVVFPQIAVVAVGLGALVRISAKRAVLRGKRFAIAGIMLSILFVIVMSGLIVSTHAWVD